MKTIEAKLAGITLYKKPIYKINLKTYIGLTPEERIARTKEDIRAFLEIAKTALPRTESLDQAAWRLIAIVAVKNPEHLKQALEARVTHSSDGGLTALHYSLKDFIDAIKSQKNKL